ncbi:MAG TPA: DUF711 family protein [Gemmatimonadaceae bacterium]|nr:DUF711 family protein [Gemmatimonadaceae bacterium]
MSDSSRRRFLASLGIAALTPSLAHPFFESDLMPSDESTPASRGVRVRTITAGVEMDHIGDRGAVERALELLARGKKRFEEAGYEVQTTRITMPPVLASLDAKARDAALASIADIDALVSAKGAVCSLGPVLCVDRADAELAEWSSEMVKATRSTSFSVVIGSYQGGVHARGAKVAAQVMHAVAGAVPNGKGSFRFAAAANIPAGTPFFPVGWHDGPESLGIGLESADLVRMAFTGARDIDDARRRLTERMTSELKLVETIAAELAQKENVLYRGIDPSPAPMGDRSIGAALEALTGASFGDAGTLRACAMVTEVLKSIPVKQCGYAGLMLPVLEDSVLSKRAIEGRYSMRDLLLFSSVCGTGLDVVPIPADTPIETLTNILLDVAAQSVKLKKPLSARLYLIPGAKPGDPVHTGDPMLTDAVVFRAT